MVTVIGDVLVEEMNHGSSIVVMATAQSVNSVNPKLLPSRGNHLFRKTIEVPPPDVVSVYHRVWDVCMNISKVNVSILSL